jgi:hypothetical protein
LRSCPQVVYNDSFRSKLIYKKTKKIAINLTCRRRTSYLEWIIYYNIQKFFWTASMGIVFNWEAG